MVISGMCMSFCTRFITSMGQGEPAMMSGAQTGESVLLKLACSSSAMNMVGTPYSEVQRSFSTVASTALASKPSPGKIIHAPWLVAARLPHDLAETVIERHCEQMRSFSLYLSVRPQSSRC